MRERVLHGLAHESGQARHQLGPEVAPHGVAAERQGQTRLFLPPHAQVEHLVQGEAREGELALVDDQAHVGSALLHLVEDPVEGHHPGAHLRREEPQGQEGRGEGAGHGHLEIGDAGGRKRLARHEQRPVAVADAAPAGHERVLVGHVGIGVEGNRGDLVPARARALVQGLDVHELVLDVEVARGHLPLGEAVEHEGVVAVGAVGQGDLHLVSRSAPAHSRAGRVTSATM